MTDPHAVLRALLASIPPGTYWSAASWHDEAVLAELKSAEIVAAQKRAVTDGWLEPVGREIAGQWSPNMVRVQHAAGDGRWVALYRRTGKGYVPPADVEPALFQMATT